MRWLVPIVLILPVVLLFPVVFGTLGVVAYLLIPVTLLFLFIRRNLHWGEPPRRKRRRSKERLIKSLNLPPEEERIVREHLQMETLRRLERR